MHSVRYIYVLISICIFTGIITAQITNQPWSQTPPKGLAATNVPQFVTFGFDDNARSGDSDSTTVSAMRWMIDYCNNLKNPAGSDNKATFDGSSVRFSFFNNSTYMNAGAVEAANLLKRVYHDAWKRGHEIGNHTHSHCHGAKYSVEQWTAEIESCTAWHVRPLPPSESGKFDLKTTEGAGIPKSVFVGFRTPYLEYEDNTLVALKKSGFLYDCSIEEGYQPTQDGKNFCWPYTLDNGSPGHELLKEWDLKKTSIGKHPGLWELPNHCYIVPDDPSCSKYGISYSLRDKMKALLSWWDSNSGKITGFDYNLFAQFRLNKIEVLAIMKNTLDLRLAGNRAPFMLGAHTQYYDKSYNGFADPETDWEDGKAIIEEFITYALSKTEVRLIPACDIITWCQNPIGLDDIHYSLTTKVIPDTIPITDTSPHPAWDATKTYQKSGTMVSHNGKAWSQNNWYSQGHEPGTDDHWIDKGPAGGYNIVLGGSIKDEGSQFIKKGANATCSFTPETGFKVIKLTIDGKDESPVSNYTFTNMSKSHTVAVKFGSGEAYINKNNGIFENSSIIIKGVTAKRMILTAQNPGEYEVRLFSVNARVISKFSTFLNKGINTISLSGINIGKQTLFIKITGDEYRSINKIVVY